MGGKKSDARDRGDGPTFLAWRYEAKYHRPKERHATYEEFEKLCTEHADDKRSAAEEKKRKYLIKGKRMYATNSISKPAFTTTVEAAPENMDRVQGYGTAIPEKLTIRTEKKGQSHDIGLFHDVGHGPPSVVYFASSTREEQAYDDLVKRLARGVKEGKKLGWRLRYNLKLHEKSLGQLRRPGPDLQGGKECDPRYPRNF
jgi:hypothetical protein